MHFQWLINFSIRTSSLVVWPSFLLQYEPPNNIRSSTRKTKEGWWWCPRYFQTKRRIKPHNDQTKSSRLLRSQRVLFVNIRNALKQTKSSLKKGYFYDKFWVNCRCHLVTFFQSDGNEFRRWFGLLNNNEIDTRDAHIGNNLIIVWAGRTSPPWWFENIAEIWKAVQSSYLICAIL